MLILDPNESLVTGRAVRGSGSLPTPVTSPPIHEVHAEVQKDVDRVTRKFARIEQVTRFAILGHALAQADGGLTPTLKVKRAIVYDKYCQVFAELYDPGRMPNNQHAGRS